MTKAEKQLNYYDLQAYKDQQPALFHMLPGWSPQVGVVKPFQKNEPLMEPNSAELNIEKTSPFLNKVKDLTRPTFSPNKALTEKGKLILKIFLFNFFCLFFFRKFS